MTAVAFTHLDPVRRRALPALALLGPLLIAGLTSFVLMDIEGHGITGMTQRVPWGLPHVFAYFLILAAPGALNIAMIASVFGRIAYKPLEPLSALLAIALLVGGLAILVLDLGRPDRLLITMFHRNDRSFFAWNIVLYTGFLGVVAGHLVTLQDGRYRRFGAATAHVANVWRFALTTGTGLDLGVLIARQTFHSAVMAPLFISFALTYGLAVFLLILSAACWMQGQRPEPAILTRLGNLLAVFVGVALYLTLTLHLVHLYAPQGRALVRFLLVEGGGYPLLFWGGQVLVGTVLPLVLIKSGRPIGAAAAVAIGGVLTVYLYMIAGQVVPQTILPGFALSSAFGDGTAAPYWPSAPEVLLGLGGVAVALTVVAGGCLAFRILPVSRCLRGSVASAG